MIEKTLIWLIQENIPFKYNVICEYGAIQCTFTSLHIIEIKDTTSKINLYSLNTDTKQKHV